MKVVVAMMKHETNTFSPVPTDWARFEQWGLHRDDPAIEAYTGTATPTGAYIQLARELDAEIMKKIHRVTREILYPMG